MTQQVFLLCRRVRTRLALKRPFADVFELMTLQAQQRHTGKTAGATFKQLIVSNQVRRQLINIVRGKVTLLALVANVRPMLELMTSKSRRFDASKLTVPARKRAYVSMCLLQVAFKLLLAQCIVFTNTAAVRLQADHVVCLEVLSQ